MRFRNDQLAFARELRQDSTDAERRLWNALRRQALGVKFRRQLPLGRYIVDFACLEHWLIIEVDGGQHLQSESDRQRDDWFNQEGYRILRFWNHEVLGNLDGVLTAIQEALKS